MIPERMVKAVDVVNTLVLEVHAAVTIGETLVVQPPKKLPLLVVGTCSRENTKDG